MDSDKKTTHRFNTRIFNYQRDFIKNKVKESNGELSEGDVLREALDLYINHRKIEKVIIKPKKK